jgi:hypothetical protein
MSLVLSMLSSDGSLVSLCCCGFFGCFFRGMAGMEHGGRLNSWVENLPWRGSNSRNELTRKKAKGNTYDTEEQKTQTRLGIMQPSRLPIAPSSLLSSPFYRPIIITLYNIYHHFFTFCEAS